MKDYQASFIREAIRCEALSFGEFTLKSGRVSPYFFNAGNFCNGETMSIVGRCYAEAIIDSGLDFDMFFGPAYKGIPLAASAAIALNDVFNTKIPYCFNRKEGKSHGEGGLLAGSPLRGKVLIIDDVMTAGTAACEAIEMITHKAGAEVSGVIIGLDRKESVVKNTPAKEFIEQAYCIPVLNIIDIDDILDFIRSSSDMTTFIKPIMKYRKTFGIAEKDQAEE
ncbi:MAG: orotate phosphoribosyltransferase [Cellvibrionales bacterium TMED148]|nr:orotate phosphoribosyltransferase [Porticoccaceae bacterium]RPG92608.1 MAG: orotate phosphoribosyltransferase [Cellvibrionales bacterium TMED148]